ncbi:MAG: V-type ATPase 116kDa subunit family protein [Thermoplasmata archaeon]
MPFLRPVPMVKVGLIGLRSDQELVVSVLYDLGIAQIEPLSKAALEVLAPERPSETARAVGEQLIRFRGLRSALPASSAGPPRSFAQLSDVMEVTQRVTIDQEVGELSREADQLTTERKSVSDQLELLDRFAFYSDRYEYLHAKNAFAFFGETSPEVYRRLREEVPQLGESQFLARPSDETVRFIVVIRSDQAEAASRLAQQNGVTLIAVPAWTGTRQEVLPQLEERRAGIDRRLAAIRTRLAEISREWYPTVVLLEEALAIENRKLEVYARFGATERTFALEAWVPQRSRDLLERRVTEATQGRTYSYAIPTAEEPPTLLDNPRGIRWYEFFIRFYSLPESTEWDPTWIFAFTFTIFFGFMLGDFGYGLVILLICLWMIRGFPGRQVLPKSIKNFVKRIMSPSGMQKLAYALIPGCLLAMGLGVFYDEVFGFQVFHGLFPGYHGIDLIAPRNVAELLLLAGYVGVGMVVFGFALGALKEYFHHRRRAAAGKIGAIAFAIALTWVGLALLRSKANGGLGYLSPTHNLPLYGVYPTLALGLAVMLYGEGIQNATMGLIEVLSHILSYTRLVGILLASVILALVINQVSFGFFHSGSIGLFVAGLVILVIGQSFNVILGVFEPGIQGARLIFVEYFSKFYTGNGRSFRPFGSMRKYTIPHHAEPTPILGAKPPS